MKRCDLCWENVEVLIKLKPEYTTGKVQEVCLDCSKQLEKALLNYNTFWDKVKREARESWWTRLLNNIKKGKVSKNL